jgi:hypothetical protein
VRQIASTAYYGGLKQCFMVRSYTLGESGYLTWPPIDREEVLVGLCNQQLRLRYPTRNKKVHYLTGASSDLNALGALLICGLIPVGIFSDKLEEEMPEHKQAADILRLWGRIQQENQQ